MTYLVGTDIGTMGTKSVLVDVEGYVRASSFREYGVINPKQGWAEQWPNVWTSAVFETIKEVVESSSIDPLDIAGASISSLYGGSGIPVDQDFKAIRPCIIWADRRSTLICKKIESEIGTEAIFNVTGNVIDPYYGYTKMLWIKENEPDNWKKIYKFEAPNSHVARLITGEESIDLSSAGNYGGIFDIHKRRWSEEMMEELEIPRNYFPEKIVSSEEIIGEITSHGSKMTNLVKGTPICAGGIDAPVSALAGGAIQDGDLASMLGTSMCNGFISHQPRLSPRLVNMPYVVNGTKITYGFTGVVTAGYCVRWFRDELGEAERRKSDEIGIDSYVLLDKEAEKIPPGSEGLIFLPHLMVGERAPYWDEHLRGGFLGLGVHHSRAHLFRAILEGVAYSMRFSIEAATEAGFPIHRMTLVDGGARSPLWRQIIADITGLAMDYIPDAKGAPLGDAILAGLGTKVITNHTVIEDWLGEKVKTKPNTEYRSLYDSYYSLYKSSLEANDIIFKNMGEI